MKTLYNMKYLSILGILVTFLIFSCTPEDTVFEMETWWHGHWQQIDDSTLIFSSGQKKIGSNEIVTPQFFISKNDTILENFHFEELIESNHKQRFKIIKTSNDSYLKIQEIEEHIEVFGPVPSMDKLESEVREFRKLPDGLMPPFPDSILFDL